jgi:hypothetical protein
MVRHVLALAFAAAICASNAQVGSRPEVRPGDQWRFAVYYAVPSATPNRVWVIDSVGDDGVAGTENGEPLRLTRDLNPRESPLTTQWDTEPLRFPLQVGKEWQYVGRVRFKDNGSDSRLETQVRVEAWERVRVVAGEFDAFRLRASTKIAGTSYGGNGQVRGESSTVYWYAPAARTIVKWTNRSTYRGESTVELVDYKLR